MELNVPGFDTIKITKADLAGPVSMAYDFHTYLHIFCLYALHTKGFATIEGKLDLAEDEAAELQRQVRIDERCFQFGEFAVIVPAVPFIAKVEESLKAQRYSAQGRLVQYYDEETFHGEIAAKDIPFRKQKRFSYQQEFRICINTNTVGTNALSVNIGDISHMCAKVRSLRLNDLLELKIEPVTATSPEPPPSPA